MLRVSIAAIIWLTLGILVVTLLGLLAALVSKAARDLRESRAQARFQAYCAMLRDPETISATDVGRWCRRSNARRESLVRAFQKVHAERVAPAPSSIPNHDAVVRSLRRELRSRSAPRRGMSLLLLGYLGGPQDGGTMAQYASDKDGDVRLCAIRSLDLLASPESFDTLLSLLSPSAAQVISLLAEARIVERLANPWAWPLLRPALLRLQPGTVQAPDAVASMPLTYAQGNRQALALMRAMMLSEIQVPPEELSPWIDQGSLDERVAAVRALTACSQELSPALETALHDKSAVVRAQAVRGIAEVAVPPDRAAAIVALLTEAITDADWWVRGYAASSLASLGKEGLLALERIAMGNDSFAAHRAEEQLALHRHRRAASMAMESA